MLRRIVGLTFMMVLLWAGPAHAEPSYGRILDTDQSKQTPVKAASGGKAASSNRARGNLARTGQDDIVPLVQGGIVLVGAGTLLVVASRRRQNVRRAAA